MNKILDQLWIFFRYNFLSIHLVIGLLLYVKIDIFLHGLQRRKGVVSQNVMFSD